MRRKNTKSEEDGITSAIENAERIRSGAIDAGRQVAVHLPDQQRRRLIAAAFRMVSNRLEAYARFLVVPDAALEEKISEDFACVTMEVEGSDLLEALGISDWSST